MSQQTLEEFVNDLEKAGMLNRIKEEKRVDELPKIMEQHAEKAVLVEKIKDSEFQFLANAYSNHDHYAWAMNCKKTETGFKIAEAAAGRIKPKIVTSAPCKEVFLKGDDVDDFEILGSFYGHAANLIKCETIDVLVPANAEIVLGTASKIGFDCTIPLGPGYNRSDFDRSAAVDLGTPPKNIQKMTEDELTKAMTDFIKTAPRSWKEILTEYHGQPYPIIYRAFGNIRPLLGRMNDEPWFRYTFSESNFVAENDTSSETNYDPRHN